MWDANCLYLDAKSRKYFLKSIHLVLAGDRKKVRKLIDATGEYLVRGVHLPFLGEEESKKQIENQKQNEGEP